MSGSGPDAELLSLFAQVAGGRIDPKEALTRWHDATLADHVRERIDEVRADLGRGTRLGFPEVVFGEGKSPEQLRKACTALLGAEPRLLVTRVGPEVLEALDGLGAEAVHHGSARAVTFGMPAAELGRVAVVAAGTTDVGVAEEAAVTAAMFGLEVHRLFDVGVSGIHRLLEHRGLLREVDAVIAVAGMEAALPGVVGGLVRVPVVAVPTSVGYGAALGGLAALASQLVSCSPGLLVVNIDNGFGAGYAVGRMALARGAAGR